MNVDGNDATAGPGVDETEDALSRTLTIVQLRKGHRAASDDVLLAWAGGRAAPAAAKVLDLGTGKGTVALLLARRLPGAEIWGVEAEEASWRLAVRNAVRNGLAERCHPLLGDLRDVSVLRGLGPFDLVCGAPPFMPLGTGILPGDRTRAAGRFEIRGGVEAYAETAARNMSPAGTVVLLLPGDARGRAVAALAGCGLFVQRALAVHPRPGRPPTYWIFTAAAAPSSLAEERLCMRDELGDGWSADYRQIRRELDLFQD